MSWPRLLNWPPRQKRSERMTRCGALRTNKPSFLLARERAKGGTLRLFALANERRFHEADSKPVFFGELGTELQL